MNASDLKPGQLAVIKSLKDHLLKRKLYEMGCVPGTNISVQFKAFGGDPIAFNIDGYCLGLRKNEALIIDVELKDFE